MRPVIAKGTCFPMFAYEVAQAIDLDAAQRRLVEDYSIFHIETFTEPCDAAMLWTTEALTVAQLLRAAPHPLSQQEIADATAARLSFGPNDATIIDTDAAMLFDPEGDDVRDI